MAHQKAFTRIGNVRKLLLIGFAMTIVPTVACAQPAPSVMLDIEAQTLSAALNQLGRQSRTEIIFSPSVVAGRRASSLKGRYTTEDAIERLIVGSNLRARRTEQGGFVIEAFAWLNPRVRTAQECRCLVRRVRCEERGQALLASRGADQDLVSGALALILLLMFLSCF